MVFNVIFQFRIRLKAPIAFCTFIFVCIMEISHMLLQHVLILEPVAKEEAEEKLSK